MIAGIDDIMENISYFIKDEELFLVKNDDKQDKSFQNNKEYKLLYQGNTLSMKQVVERQNITKVILIGDWSQISPVIYFIKTYIGKNIKILSDLKYGIVKEQYLPVVRVHNNKENNLSVEYQKRVLILIDRPIKYHIDAYYFYQLCKPFYNIDIWYKNENVECYFKNKYDILVHYGHADINSFIFGKNRTDILPDANIIISHGCHSLQLVQRKNFHFNAFCGFSYFCDGQIPSNGSNRLIMYLLNYLLSSGDTLSQSLVKAKKQYITENIKCDLNKSILIANSNQELVDLTTVIACNSLLDSRLSLTCINKICSQSLPNGKYYLPNYIGTILLIIYSDDRLSEIAVYENDDEIRYINVNNINRYLNWVGHTDIIIAQYKNETWVLLNRLFLAIKFNTSVIIQQYYN